MAEMVSENLFAIVVIIFADNDNDISAFMLRPVA
jgi:hypothetical protein